MDCGGRFPPECMDFDHRDRATKKAQVSVLVQSGSVTQILAEVAKCDVVCANCHRIRTRRRRRAERAATVSGLLRQRLERDATAELILADIGRDASITRGLGRVHVDRAALVPHDHDCYAVAEQLPATERDIR